MSNCQFKWRRWVKSIKTKIKKSPKKVSSMATTALRFCLLTCCSQASWNCGNKSSICCIWVRKAVSDTPTWWWIRINLKNRDNFLAPTPHSNPNRYKTAKTSNLNHALPASVSQKKDSGCRLRSFCTQRWRCTLLLAPLISWASLPTLCLPPRPISTIIAWLAARIFCVVLFFSH